MTDLDQVIAAAGHDDHVRPRKAHPKGWEPQYEVAANGRGSARIPVQGVSTLTVGGLEAILAHFFPELEDLSILDVKGLRGWDSGENVARWVNVDFDLNRVVVRDEELDAMVAAAADRKPVPSRAAATDDPLVVCLSDWQMGKALHDDTPILTTSGWTTHGDLRPGDCVYGDDGLPKRITAVTGSTVQDLYRVTFDDGAEILASGNHIWEGWRRYKDAEGVYARRRVKMTTAEHAEMKRHGARRPQGDYYTNPLAVDLTLPLDGASVDPLPIDPYLLGAWLGDGNARSGWLTCSEEDSEHWLDAFPGAYEITPNSRNVSVRIPGLTANLRRLGVLGDKHIPDAYLRASADHRLALVQGLMDTDGHITPKGYAEFVQVNERVADGMAYLLRSLGLKVKRSIKQTERRPAHLLRFTPDTGYPSQRVARMDRKADRLVERDWGQWGFSFVRSVEPEGEGSAQCITVEGGLYLCGEELKVTHNSDGDGVAGLVGRLVELEESLVAEVKARRPSVLYLAGLGDLVEGCDGHYAMQAFAVELDRRSQVRAVRRILWRLIDRLSRLVANVVVVCVPGNHGENRRDAKAYTTFGDNDDVAVFEQVAEIAAANPERYGHVSFVIPDNDLTVTLDVAGTVVGFAHGHQARTGSGGPPGKLRRWREQMADQRHPIGDADVVVTGHYHHLTVIEDGAKTWMQCPALDGGSKWWEESGGASTRAATLTFRVGREGWHSLKVLR